MQIRLLFLLELILISFRFDYSSQKGWLFFILDWAAHCEGMGNWRYK